MKRKMEDGGKPKNRLAPTNIQNINFLAPNLGYQRVTPQERRNYYKELSTIDAEAQMKYESSTPKMYLDTEEKLPPLTKGKLRGATPNKRMIEDLVASADKYGIPRSQMLAIAANESMFGRGYRDKGLTEMGHETGSSQKDVVSAWNMDLPYKREIMQKFLYDKGVPHIQLLRNKIGYQYIEDLKNIPAYRKSVDSALSIHPEWVDEYRDINKRVVPQGDINYFDLTAEAAKKYGVGSSRFNPGDPNYSNKIKSMQTLIESDPILQPYTNTKKEDGGYIANINTMKRIRLRKMDNGGTIGSTTNLSDQNMFSNPIFRFNGPSHKEGGIPINYRGNNVEVEGDETGYIDNKGDLTVFGNLYVPGTNKKFKSVSKDIANTEAKATSRLKYASTKMNDIRAFDDPMEQLTANSASIVGKSAIQQQQKATNAKEQLASLQERMLGTARYLGVEPKALWGKADNGKKLKKSWEPNPPDIGQFTGINWIDDSTPDWLRPVANVDVPRDRLGYDLQSLPSSTKYPVRTRDVSRELTRPVSDRKVEATGPVKDWYFPSTTGRVYNQGLPLGQIIPELFTLATNRKEFVPSQSFVPTLEQPYTVSYQDRLNQNNSTFRAIAQTARNNPAAASQLAAQKYQADNQVLGEQFRTNQSIQNQITNRNIELINQAQLTNLNLNREATIAREQNAAATRATTREALKSIANKSEQMRQYNRDLTLYNQLVPHYQYDPNSGQWMFDENGPGANITVGGLPVQYTPPNLYGESRVTNYNRDAKGRVTTKREDRAPGLMKIFR